MLLVWSSDSDLWCRDSITTWNLMEFYLTGISLMASNCTCVFIVLRSCLSLGCFLSFSMLDNLELLGLYMLSPAFSPLAVLGEFKELNWNEKEITTFSSSTNCCFCQRQLEGPGCLAVVEELQFPSVWTISFVSVCTVMNCFCFLQKRALLSGAFPFTDNPCQINFI